MAARTLLVLSARLDLEARRQVATGRWPRKDFFELARALDAEVLDLALLDLSRPGRSLARVAGPAAAQAALAFARRGEYDAIFTDGEHIGLPLAVLLARARRRPRHVTIGHLLSTRGKQRFARALRPGSGLDLALLHATTQRAAAAALGLGAEQTRLIPYGVDTRFWSPRGTYSLSPSLRGKGDEDEALLAEGGSRLREDVWAGPLSSRSVRSATVSPSRHHLQPNRSADVPLPFQGRGQGIGDPGDGGLPLICSAGLEYRDYETLAASVAGLPLRAVLAAGSRWSRHGGPGAAPLPQNIALTRLDYVELRDLYAAARFVVVPLHEVENQAGVTTLLEAMAMGKAVIVSATRGQRDLVRGRLWTAAGPSRLTLGDPAVFGVAGAEAMAETGIYVPPGDPAALRAAIRHLLDHPDEAARLGAAGRALVGRWFSLERYVAEIAAAVEGREARSWAA